MLKLLVAAVALIAAAPACLADANEDLLTAVFRGDLPALNQALQQGASAEAHGEQEATALMLAAERGHTAIMSALLTAGAGANTPRPGGITPLMHAAASGKADAVQLLLDAHAEVRARSTRTGITALRVAVAIGSLDTTQRLLAAGADRDDQDEAGARLLFTAASSGSVKLVELFLTPGEDVNRKRSTGGYTALDVALERQHWDAAQYLIEHGATIASSVTGKQNALQKLLELEPVVQPGKPNPLVQVVDLPSIALFRTLLEQGAATSFKDEKGNTLLMLAAKRHHVTAVEALLAAGVDVHARNAEGDTALTIASGKSEYELIVVGLGLALGQDRDSLMRLVFRPAPKSAESPSTARRLQAAKMLLSARANPNARDNGGNTPLIEATRTGDAELVAMLIEAGANVNAKNESGAAPLLVAAQFGLHEIAAALLRAHADLTIRDGEGRNALELARAGKHEKMIGLLEQASSGI
jgi:ankyrin repeat protein